MGKNTAVCMGWRVVSTALVVVACAVAAAPASAVGGHVWYASSTGSGGKCTEKVPCALSIAVGEAGAGDEVLLLPGQYGLPKFSGLIIDKEISFGGTVGEPATLETGENSNLQVVEKAQATLHDLRIEGEGALKLESGTAERIFVAHFGVHDDACELNKGTTLRNSVCWTLEDNEEEVGVSNALGIAASGENQDKPVVLRGVTAIADTKTGNAIHLLSAASAHLNVDAANVIARSVNGTDIVAEIDPKSEFSRTHLNIADSDFGEAESHAPETEVTPIGTNGNISGAPSFLDLAHGDFHVGGESPTLDGGISDPSVGSVDLEGHARAQAKCFGASPVPDMGAFERTATAACPPPPPLPPRPVEPKKPVFRVLSLLLNKKTGGGRLLVEVPGAGTLSLTGSGVKLVRRTAPAEGGVISLPIQAWAITKVRLAKTGKTKVHLRVSFEGPGRGFEEWAKAVLLRKKSG